MTWVNPTTPPNHNVYGFYAEHANGLYVHGYVKNLNYADFDEVDPALGDEVIADIVAVIGAASDFSNVHAWREGSVVTTTYTP